MAGKRPGYEQIVFIIMNIKIKTKLATLISAISFSALSSCAQKSSQALNPFDYDGVKLVIPKWQSVNEILDKTEGRKNYSRSSRFDSKNSDYE